MHACVLPSVRMCVHSHQVHAPPLPLPLSETPLGTHRPMSGDPPGHCQGTPLAIVSTPLHMVRGPPWPLSGTPFWTC